ncbi:hypothetical protein N7501_001601 [Penicillium viridicatum]|nr:hypothetical protein N7501_001601 [Penicillium viridicatum]
MPDQASPGLTPQFSRPSRWQLSPLGGLRDTAAYRVRYPGAYERIDPCMLGTVRNDSDPEVPEGV